MILSFINIHKATREVLKTSGEHLPRDLANVNEWKIIFDPSQFLGIFGIHTMFCAIKCHSGTSIL